MTLSTYASLGRLTDLDNLLSSTTNEKRLGRIVRAKYDTDYFIIDKFPMALRPFYTMPDPEDPVRFRSFSVPSWRLTRLADPLELV